MLGIQLNDYDRKVWEEELADFVPDRFIDCHVHIWEPGTRKTSEKGCVKWTSLVASSQTYEDMMASYDHFFPGKKFTQVVMCSPSCNLPVGNAYAEKMFKEHNLKAYYCTNWDTDEKEIFDAMQRGFIGIKPYQNNSPKYIPAKELRIFDFLTPRQLEFMDKIGGTVMLHIPRDLRLRDPINLHQLMEIDERYPNAKVIVAHIGRAYIPSDVGDAFDLLKNTKHLFYDFSANTSAFAMQKLFENIDIKRCMFGSDMPFTKMRMFRIEKNGTYVNVVPRGLYPNTDTDPHMEESDNPNITTFMYEELRAFKEAAKNLGLTRENVEDLMYNNASKFYGIEL